MKPSYAELEKRVAELERQIAVIRKSDERTIERMLEKLTAMTRRGGAYSKAVRG